MKNQLLLCLIILITTLNANGQSSNSNSSQNSNSETYWYYKNREDVINNYDYYLEYLNYLEYYFNNDDSNTRQWRGKGYNGFSDFHTKNNNKAGIYRYVDWKVFKATDFLIYYTDSVVAFKTDSVLNLAIDSATVLSNLAQQTAIDSATILSNMARETAIDSAIVLSDIAKQTAIDSSKVMDSILEEQLSTALKDSLASLTIQLQEYTDSAKSEAINKATSLANLAQETAIDSAIILSNVAKQSAIDSSIVMYGKLETQLTAVVNDSLTSLRTQLKQYTDTSKDEAVSEASALANTAQKNAIDSSVVMYANLETQLTAVVNDSLSSITSQLKVYTDAKVEDVEVKGLNVDENENIGIGTDSPDYKLDVNGTVRATKILVEANGNTADFVFADDYELKDLLDVEAFVKENKHLEGIPSAEEMENKGVNLAEMNKLLLQKVEELTLYVISQKQESIKKDSEIKEVKGELLELKTMLKNFIAEK